MKNLKVLLLFVIAFIAVTCQRNVLNQVSEADREFQLCEAREFFENRRANLVTRGAMLTSEKDNLIVPHEYTPVWGKAEYSESDDYFLYEVPLRTSRPLVASRIDFRSRERERYIAPIEQRVVVFQNRITKKVTSYVMSIIPDKSYVDKTDAYKYLGIVDGFSGLVTYSSLDGDLAMVMEFRDGEHRYSLNMRSAKMTKEDIDRNLFLTFIGTNIYRVEQTRGDDDPMLYVCEKCGGTGCEMCKDPIIVTPERCSKCGEFLSQCVCNDNGNYDDDDDDDDEFPPIPPQNPSSGSTSGGSAVNYYQNTISNINTNNSVVDYAIKSIMQKLADSFGDEFANLLNTRLRDEIKVMNYYDATSSSVVDQTKINWDLMAQVQFRFNEGNDLIGAYILFDKELNGYLNEVGVEIVMLHELYHIYYALKHGYGNNLDVETHKNMRFGTDYRDWLTEMFPDLVNYADTLKYAGTENVDDSGELPKGYAPIIDSIIRVK